MSYRIAETDRSNDKVTDSGRSANHNPNDMSDIDFIALIELSMRGILYRVQLSPPHGTNKKLKCETKNKTMSMIGPVQSRCHEGSPV